MALKVVIEGLATYKDYDVTLTYVGSGQWAFVVNGKRMKNTSTQDTVANLAKQDFEYVTQELCKKFDELCGVEKRKEDIEKAHTAYAEAKRASMRANATEGTSQETRITLEQKCYEARQKWLAVLRGDK